MANLDNDKNDEIAVVPVQMRLRTKVAPNFGPVTEEQKLLWVEFCRQKNAGGPRLRSFSHLDKNGAYAKVEMYEYNEETNTFVELRKDECERHRPNRNLIHKLCCNQGEVFLINKTDKSTFDYQQIDTFPQQYLNVEGHAVEPQGQIQEEVQEPMQEQEQEQEHRQDLPARNKPGDLEY